MKFPYILVLLLMVLEGMVVCRASDDGSEAVIIEDPDTIRFQPWPGFYDTPQEIRVMLPQHASYGRYTLDGREPTDADPVVPIIGIRLSTNAILTVKSWTIVHSDQPVLEGQESSWTVTDIRQGSYTFHFGVLEFSPEAGEYHSEQHIRLSTPNATGTSIRFTLDGTEPTQLSPVLKEGESIPIDEAIAVKARAWHPELGEGVTQSANYSFRVAPIIFSPPPGEILRGETVELKSATEGTAFTYAVAGGDSPFIVQPGLLEWRTYTAPITVNSNVVISVMANKDGYSPADATAAYKIKLAPRPIFEPSAGPITKETYVSMSAGLNGATVRYTLDGSDPTEDSAVYSVPVRISPNTRVKARTFHPRHEASHVRYTYFREPSLPLPEDDPIPNERPHLKLTPVPSGPKPVWVTHAGDGSGRVFIVSEAGLIYVVGKPIPFLTTGVPIVLPAGGELAEHSTGLQLLSAAFPANYDSKAYFYISYRLSNGTVRVSRLSSASNPDVADPSSEEIIGDYWTDASGGQLIFSEGQQLFLNRGGPISNRMPTAFFFDPEIAANKLTYILSEPGWISITPVVNWSLKAYLSESQKRGGVRYRGAGRRLRGWHILGSSDGRLFGAGMIDGEVREHELFKLTYSIVLPFLTFEGDFVAVNEVENGDIYAVNYGKEYWWQGTTSRVGDAVFRIEDDGSVFSLRALKEAEGEVALEWFAASGIRYQLQGSADFNEWENVGNAVEGVDTVVRQGRPDSSAAKRFYRVVLE